MLLVDTLVDWLQELAGLLLLELGFRVAVSVQDGAGRRGRVLRRLVEGSRYLRQIIRVRALACSSCSLLLN